MARCLYASLELSGTEHLAFGPRAPYLAKQLVLHPYDALAALPEIEANPLACGPAVYRLVTGPVRDNAVAHEVFLAAERYPHERPASADPAAARAAVPGRLPALRAARSGPAGDQRARDRRN